MQRLKLQLQGVTDAVKNGHAVAGPMTVFGSTAASTLWWDGRTVAKNVSDAEAEATFIAMMNGIRPSMMEDEAIRTHRPFGSLTATLQLTPL